LLIGINKNAYEKISVVRYTYSGKTYIVKPFPVFYGQMFITIDELVEGGVISEKDLFYMSYYFSQGLTPNILLYFDHKIADEPSTFLRLYNYGYVVPTNFDTVNYEPRYEQFLDNRNQGHKLNYVQTQFYKLFKKYYHSRELPNGPQDITQPIKFVPFINNCFNVEKIIQHPLITYVNYFILITDMNAELVPGAIKNDEHDDHFTKFTEKKEKRIINPEDEKFIDMIYKIENSKYYYHNYRFADIYFLILKMFFLRKDNIYKNMDIDRMLTDERPPGFDLENIDLDLFNLSVIQKYIDVCKLILLIRDHRCDLSFYKFDIAEYANKFDTQEVDEAPMPLPWEDPFKYWTKGKASDGKASDGKASDGKASDGKASDGKASDGKASKGGQGQSQGQSQGQRTKRKKQNKRRKSQKYKKSRK
jgi:hypothetical protein